MLGFFGKKEHKELADRIGVEIHRQLFEALKVNETDAGVRLSSVFIVGYLYGFISFSFSVRGYDGEKLSDKYTKHICNGVLPGKLYDIFMKQLAALEIAKELGKQEEVELFEQGAEVGAYDSGVFKPLVQNEANNMFNYLTNNELSYEKMFE